MPLLKDREFMITTSLRRLTRSIIVITTAGFCLTGSGANIIFDLDGVLVTQNPFSVAWEIGPLNFIGIFNPLRIEDLVMEFLDRLMPYTPDIPKVTHNGRVLPAVMVIWLLGFITPQEIVDMVHERIKIESRGMDSKRKAALIEQVVKMIFVPERFARTTKPIYKGVKLLKRCHRARNADGSRKNKIFILSNWDCSSFRHLFRTEEFQEFFDLCDGILISGDIHLVKPDPRAYQAAYHAFGIDPNKELTILIDDTPENFEGAHSLGHRMVRTIECKNKKLKPVKLKLRKMEVI